MNILQQFLADRAGRGKPPKNPIVNDAPQVTRAEFNTLARAVEGLIEDAQAVLSPEKITAAISNAIAALPPAKINTSGPGGKFTAPPGDDDQRPLHNKDLPFLYLAPKGDD